MILRRAPVEASARAVAARPASRAVLLELARRRPRGIAGIGDVAALVVGAERQLPPGELRRRAMAGIGDDEGGAASATTRFIDQVTGGKLTELDQTLDDIGLLLKISAGCAAFAGIAALIALRRK